MYIVDQLFCSKFLDIVYIILYKSRWLETSKNWSKKETKDKENKKVGIMKHILNLVGVVLFLILVAFIAGYMVRGSYDHKSSVVAPGTTLISSDDIVFVSGAVSGLVDDRDWRVKIIKTNQPGPKILSVRLAGTNELVYRTVLTLNNVVVGERVRLLQVPFAESATLDKVVVGSGTNH